MNIQKCRFVRSVLALSLLPIAAYAADPVEFEGRHYQVVADPEISWEEANAAATAATFMGVNGHLATITSEAEDAFIDQQRTLADLGEVWVGGQQAACEPEPGCGWTWVNGEGPISTPQFPLPSYSNWLQNEPNDLNTEKYMGVGLGGDFGWNDEQALINIDGYVIEFDTATAIDPGDCQSANGCQTTVGQIIAYPPNSVQEGAQVGVKTYEFTDNPSRCGVAPLTLFGSDGIPDNELIIPPYLCGHPKFLVVAVETSGVEVVQGSVIIENEVLDALPSNLYECFGPKGVIPPVDLDPQHRDKVGFQRTNPAKMLENDIGGTVSPVYAGSLSEVTFECGSSRGKGNSSSYYVIGLSINFGAGYDLATNPDPNRHAFAALTRYKLVVLLAAIDEAKAKGSLNNLTYKILKAPIVAAIKLHDRKKYSAALLSVRIFRLLSSVANYGTVADENYSGEHDMRSSNIDFMYTDSVIPFN